MIGSWSLIMASWLQYTSDPTVKTMLNLCILVKIWIVLYRFCSLISFNIDRLTRNLIYLIAVIISLCVSLWQTATASEASYLKKLPDPQIFSVEKNIGDLVCIRKLSSDNWIYLHSARCNQREWALDPILCVFRKRSSSKSEGPPLICLYYAGDTENRCNR